MQQFIFTNLNWLTFALIQSLKLSQINIKYKKYYLIPEQIQVSMTWKNKLKLF